MSSFVYFFPGHQSVIASRQQVPLAIADMARSGLASRASVGPGGRNGRLVTFGPDASRFCAFNEEQQTWSQEGDYWVGFWNDNRPGPGDLERDSGIPGQTCELGGQSWRIPIVHALSPAGDGFYTTLPRILKTDDQGNPFLDPERRYDELRRSVQWLFERIIVESLAVSEEAHREDWPLDDLETLQLNARLLGVNYYLSVAEISALELLKDDETRYKPCLIAIGFQAFLEEAAAQKKTLIASPG